MNSPLRNASTTKPTWQQLHEVLHHQPSIVLHPSAPPLLHLKDPSSFDSSSPAIALSSSTSPKSKNSIRSMPHSFLFFHSRKQASASKDLIVFPQQTTLQIIDSSSQAAASTAITANLPPQRQLQHHRASTVSPSRKNRQSFAGDNTQLQPPPTNVNYTAAAAAVSFSSALSRSTSPASQFLLTQPRLQNKPPPPSRSLPRTSPYKQPGIPSTSSLFHSNSTTIIEHSSSSSSAAAAAASLSQHQRHRHPRHTHTRKPIGQAIFIEDHKPKQMQSTPQIRSSSSQMIAFKSSQSIQSFVTSSPQPSTLSSSKHNLPQQLPSRKTMTYLTSLGSSPSSAASTAMTQSLRTIPAQSVYSSSSSSSTKKSLLTSIFAHRLRNSQITQPAISSSSSTTPTPTSSLLSEDIALLQQNLLAMQREFISSKKIGGMISPLVSEISLTYLRAAILQKKPNEEEEQKCYQTERATQQSSRTTTTSLSLKDKVNITILEERARRSQEDTQKVLADLQRLNASITNIIEERLRLKVEQISSAIIEESQFIHSLERSLAQSLERRAFTVAPSSDEPPHQRQASSTTTSNSRKILLAKYNYRPVDSLAFQSSSTTSSQGTAPLSALFSTSHNSHLTETSRLGEFPAIDKQAIAINKHLDSFFHKILQSTASVKFPDRHSHNLPSRNSTTKTQTMIPSAAASNSPHSQAESTPKIIHNLHDHILIDDKQEEEQEAEGEKEEEEDCHYQ